MFRFKVLGFISWIFIRLYSLTWRYQVFYEDDQTAEIVEREKRIKKPEVGHNNIYAIWHQDEIAILPYFAKSKFVALVSFSNDGVVMATMLKLMGLETVRGSSSKKPVAAFFVSLKKILQGYRVALAVDGPRGPIYEAKEGIIKMANKAQRPIVAIRAVPENHWTSWRSWNQARIPKPFSRVKLFIHRPRNYDKKSLEDALNLKQEWPEKYLGL